MKKHILLGAASVALITASLYVTSCMFIPKSEEKLEFSKNKNSVSLGKTTYKLVWQDEFDQASLNTDDWNRVVWNAGKVNNEVQKYVADASYSKIGPASEGSTDGSSLKIVAKKNSGTWSSARIDTSDKQKFKYGYFEARIKMPVAYKATTASEANYIEDNKGVWPAFWMMPNGTDDDPNGMYGVWPRSGELDIMEYSPSTSGQSVYSTIHHATSATDAKDSYSSLGKNQITAPSYDDEGDWHTYGLLWTSGTLESFFDGESRGTVYANPGNKNWAKWPYDQDFYIILNLAMGGNLGGAINSSMQMAEYEIDYVRVYQ